MSIEPIIEYFDGLNDYDMGRLLEILELSKKCLVFDDCKEQFILDNLLMAVWTTIKLKE
jgi:hypothetical protein